MLLSRPGQLSDPKENKASKAPEGYSYAYSSHIVVWWLDNSRGKVEEAKPREKWVSACFCNSPKLDYSNHVVKVHWILLTTCCQMSTGLVPQAGITTRQHPQQSSQDNYSYKRTTYHWISSYPTTGLQDWLEVLCLSDKDHSVLMDCY